MTAAIRASLLSFLCVLALLPTNALYAQNVFKPVVIAPLPPLRFYLDKEPVGDDYSTLETITKSSLKNGNILNIVIPDEVDLIYGKYRQRFEELELLPYWYLQGIKTNFFHKGKKCDMRLFWASVDKDDGDNPSKFEYYLDGVFLGYGGAGLDKLADVKWGDYPELISIQWTGSFRPYRASSPYIGFEFTSALEHHHKAMRSLEEKKVNYTLDKYEGDIWHVFHPKDPVMGFDFRKEMINTVQLPTPVVGNPIVEMTDWGLYEKVTGVKTAKRPSTEPGPDFTESTFAKFIRHTDRIPMKPDFYFGYSFKLANLPLSGSVELVTVIYHPVFDYGKSTSSRESYTTIYALKDDVLTEVIGHRLKPDKELIPGDWTFEQWYCGKRILTKTFTVEASDEARKK